MKVIADDTTVHAASYGSKLSCAKISADLDVAAEWTHMYSWGKLGHTFHRREKLAHAHRVGKRTARDHEGCLYSRGQTPPHMELVLNRHSETLESNFVEVKMTVFRKTRPCMKYESQVWTGHGGPTQSIQKSRNSSSKRQLAKISPEGSIFQPSFKLTTSTCSFQESLSSTVPRRRVLST